MTAVTLMGLHLRPRRFALAISLLLGTVFVVGLINTALFGGLVESGLVVIFNLAIVLAALLALGYRAASWWFVAFVGSVVYAALIHNRVDPVYEPQPSSVAAWNLIAVGVLTFAVTVYFVRQRDRFQRQSDDLLHSILPDEIAARLKANTSMIAESFESASVLFADVVDFTPMSAGMSAAELGGPAQPHLHDLRRVRGGTGAREDQDHRRRVHGRVRRARPEEGPRRGCRRPGAEDAGSRRE
jgi:adenylate cyclase